MTDELKELSECLLVFQALFSASELKIDFGEVHAYCLGNHALEELVHEIELEAISFVSACAEELRGVNTINVEGDPVLAFSSLMVKVTMNVRVDLIHLLWLAIGRVKDE